MIELRKAIALETLRLLTGATHEQIRNEWLDREARERQRNATGHGARRNDVDGTPQEDPVAAAMCAGWNDVVLGKWVEKADRIDQLNYELGRAMASATRSVQKLHPWPPSMTYPELLDRGLVSAKAHALLVAEDAFFTKDVA